jgi:hypothetical protein
MGGPRHLPRHDRVRVVLAGGEVAEADEVRLRLELQDGLLQVRADERRLRGHVGGIVVERCDTVAAAVDEEPVVDVGHRVHGVDVGRHAAG